MLLHKDILNSRDIQKEIDELEGFREDAQTEVEDIRADIKALEECIAHEEDRTGLLRDEAKVTELRDELEELAHQAELRTVPASEGEPEYFTSDDFTDDEFEELKALQAFKDEVYAYGWNGGTTFIRDSYFEDYAREVAESIGAIDSNAKWPLDHIDWDAAAEALKTDYRSANLEGDTYWYRS